jgi:hypothetical protein
MNYEFVDAQEMGRLHPDTFDVPTPKELACIKKGTFVKVCCNDERFWVEVTKVDGEKLTGTVGNDLVDERNEDLYFGREIEIEKKNVYDTMEG